MTAHVARVVAAVVATACSTLLNRSPAGAEDLATGHVVYVTTDHAFVDRGSSDGLHVGDTLTLWRRGQQVATCQLERVAAHRGRCSSVPDGVGLIFALGEPAPAPQAPPLPAPYRHRTEGRLRTALAATQSAWVDFAPSPVGRLRRRARAAWAALGHDSWLLFGGNDRHIERERLDVGIVGASLWANSPWQASLQMTAIAFSARDEQSRFRPGTPAMLFIKQAQVDNARAMSGLQVAAGRVGPGHLPGLAVLDGAQVGYARPGGQSHVGGYAGFLPLLATLAPSADRFTVGGYSRLVRQFGPKATVQHDGRLAFVGLPRGQSRFELESRLDWRHRGLLAISLNPRFGLLTQGGKARLEAMRADLVVDPSRHVHLYSGMRLATADFDLVTGLGAYATGFRTTVHSYSGLTVSPLRWLALTGQNAVAWDKASGTLHVLSGPELGLPRLFGARGGASIAYMVENKRARSAYLQSRLAVSRSVSLSLRTTYFEDVFQTDNLLREMSLFLGTRAQLSRWLYLDVSVLGRHGLHNARVATDAPYSLRTSLRLTGRF